MDCFCLSARGICRWSWQMLKLVLLFNASCSSAGGHCPSCLVLTERAESLGRGAGESDFHAWNKNSPGGPGKGILTFFELLCWDGHRAASCFWVCGKDCGHRPHCLTQFPSPGRKHLLLPPSELFSELLCETFLRSACIPFLVVNWFRRSFVDSPASKAAIYLLFLSKQGREAPARERGKIKMPFYWLINSLSSFCMFLL
jgi:hypothetical protein